MNEIIPVKTIYIKGDWFSTIFCWFMGHNWVNTYPIRMWEPRPFVQESFCVRCRAKATVAMKDIEEETEYEEEEYTSTISPNIISNAVSVVPGRAPFTVSEHESIRTYIEASRAFNGNDQLTPEQISDLQELREVNERRRRDEFNRGRVSYSGRRFGLTSGRNRITPYPLVSSISSAEADWGDEDEDSVGMSGSDEYMSASTDYMRRYLGNFKDAEEVKVKPDLSDRMVQKKTRRITLDD